MNIQKVIIYAAFLLDIIWISVIIPAFPELKAYYQINEFQVTLWLTIYSLCAFLSAPVLWQISDKFGRKQPLIRCVIWTAISYLILLSTQQYRIFIISRLINWITGWNISILQAILTDISPDPETKKKNFGIMWAIFGMWFIIWPVIWSLLLKYSNVEWIFWFGWIFAIIEVILLITHFHNTNKPDDKKILSFNSFGLIYKYLKHPTMREYILSLALLWMGGFIINIAQSFHMQNLFGTTGEQYGYILWTVWILGAINMWYLVPNFWTKKFSNRFLIILAHITLISGYFILWFTTSFVWFLAIFYLTVFLSWFYMPVYNVEIMWKAKRDEIGEVSGMMWWIQSLMMFIWPLIGWLLLNYHLNIFFGAVIFIILSLVVMIRLLFK